MLNLCGKGKLFEEIWIGTMKVPNRIVAAPFTTRLASVEGFATPELIDYWSQRARGGAGLVIVEACNIDRKTSRLERNQLGIWGEDCHVGLAQIAEAIHTEGARSSIQLCHAGRQTTPAAIEGRLPVGPSPIPCKYMSQLLGRPNETRELSIDEIEEIIEDFVSAARRAKGVRFDSIELHFAHGYLVGSFLSNYTNKRNDIYGGPLENRARMALEIVKRIRCELGPGYPIGVRLSGDEYVDGGINIEETKTVAKWLEKAGVDYIHVSASCYETAEMQCPTIYQPEGLLVYLAKQVKKVVHVPVITVAAITPELASDIIEKGDADMVAIGRGLNADPDMPNKIAADRLSDIIPCIRCNRCLEAEGLEIPTRCDVNFLTGRSTEHQINRAGTSKNVVIIGGGPSGLEAARVAALRGHKVKLFEKKSQLGGALLSASVPEFLKDFRKLIAYYETQLVNLGVEIILNKEVQADGPEITSLTPDVLIIAIGAKPITLKIAGSKNEIVSQVIDVLQGKVALGDNIVIIGGSFVSCQLALYLARQKGKKVIMATKRKSLNVVAREIEIVSSIQLVRELLNNNVDIRLGYDPVKIDNNVISFRTAGGEIIKINTDNVIASLGFKPDKRKVGSYRQAAPAVYAVGDCIRAKTIGPSIHEGFIAGYNV